MNNEIKSQAMTPSQAVAAILDHVPAERTELRDALSELATSLGETVGDWRRLRLELTSHIPTPAAPWEQSVARILGDGMMGRLKDLVAQVNGAN